MGLIKWWLKAMAERERRIGTEYERYHLPKMVMQQQRHAYHAQQQMQEAWKLLAESRRQLDEAHRLVERAERLQRLEQGERQDFDSTIRSCLQCGFPLPLGYTPRTCPYCQQPQQA